MPLRTRRFNLHTLLYVCAVILIIAAGIGAYIYVDNQTNVQESDRLVTRVQSAATLIEPAMIASLSISDADLTNPAYLSLKKKMIALKAANTDLRFVYLMAERDGHVYFVVDSEVPLSEGYSPPGQEYGEASPALLAGFQPGNPYVLETYADRWGDWISALAPITDGNGTVVALIGFDESAVIHQRVFLTEVGLVIFATLVLLLLILVLYILNKQEADFATMRSDFVAIASHELRSPLSSIRWSLSELRENKSISTETRTIVNDLYMRICALIERTGTFLQTTAADHGVMDKHDLKTMDVSPLMLACVVRAETLAAPKKIHITRDPAFDSPIILRGDSERLRLVFDNLLSNAIKYSPEGSTVSLNFKDEVKTKVFAVHDSGIGIPKSEMKAIFGGFHRTANAKRSGALGSGFGLYIAKKIVNFHGGTLTCESEVGHGSTFVVTLPVGV